MNGRERRSPGGLTAPARRYRAAVAVPALCLLAASILAGEAAAQDLAGRVAAEGDGTVRFEYEAREGVCGWGDGITVSDGVHVRRGDGCDCPCREGPVRVELRVEDGRVTGFDTRVGRPWPAGAGATDLGAVPPGEAADYLLDLAAEARESVGEDAVFAATLARGVEPWPRLLDLARADGVPSGTKRAAVFWLGQAAGAAATEGLVSVIESPEELEVREHAVFALSQREDRESVEALIRIARSNPEPELRKKALFWLGQREDDPRVLRLFEELLTGG